MKAVIMAGGFGTRIQPLTNSIPKPMLPVLNKPMMQHVLESLRDIGIKEMVVLLYYMPEVIKSHFGDGSEFGVKINYVVPDDDYGTAGAVKKAKEFLDESFIIVSGDLITDFNFQELIDFHAQKSSKLTIGLTSVSDPLQFGVVIAGADGRIQKFLEKPSWGEVFSDTINTGIYIIEPEILNYILDSGAFDFAKELFPLIMREGIPLWGKNLKGYWRDVGNPKSYRDVFEDILNGVVRLKIGGFEVKKSNGTLYLADENMELPEDLEVEGNVLLGKNVTIGKGVTLINCVVGNDVVIGKKSELESSILWDRVEIGEKNSLNLAVICNDNRLGRKVKIKQGAVIAEKCVIENLVSVEKDVTIWPNKEIEEGAILSNSVVWGDKYKSSIFNGGVVSGRTNVELSCELSIKLAEAFGSMLPAHSTVYLSRDYHKTSRMLKRAFFAGLMSAGINVIDLRVCPSNIMRYSLTKNKNISAGVHFRQSINNPMNTEILFYNDNALPIDTNSEKNCERVFFRESFRRVNFNEIGEILAVDDIREEYVNDFISQLDKDVITNKKPKIVVDIMHGSTADVYPRILNILGIENIVLSAYADTKKLHNITKVIEKSQEDVSKIVQTLTLDAGFMIYPNGQRVQLIANSGEILDTHITLLVVLSLFDKVAPKDTKVLLPVWAPDVLDSSFKNIVIERAKISGMSASKMRNYALVANVEGNFTFTNFSLSNDALFASVKIVEMLAKTDTTISDILKTIPEFFYENSNVTCPSAYKGKMMRKFMEASVGKEASFVDGVKISLDDKSWILMIPDQHDDSLHLSVQTATKESGETLKLEFVEKIKHWISEE